MIKRRSYPDLHQHLKQHVHQAADRYVAGIEREGLQRSVKLEKALANRAYEEGQAQYHQECEEVLSHNLSVIESQHRSRMNALKREGAKMRLWTCPPIALFLVLLAWASFHASNVPMGVIYAAGAFAWLCLLVGGWIFDRPTAESKGENKENE